MGSPAVKSTDVRRPQMFADLRDEHAGKGLPAPSPMSLQTLPKEQHTQGLVALTCTAK